MKKTNGNFIINVNVRGPQNLSAVVAAVSKAVVKAGRHGNTQVNLHELGGTVSTIDPVAELAKTQAKQQPEASGEATVDPGDENKPPAEKPAGPNKKK